MFFSVSNKSPEKKVNTDNIFEMLSHMVPLLYNNEKTEDITIFAYYHK